MWCPIPLLTWLLPVIGHLGVCDADGRVTDFLGPRFVHRGSLGFGAVARFWRLDLARVDGGARGWDAAVRRAEAYFGDTQPYHLLGNNCHQYVAHAMNLAAYDGKADWNMVHLALAVVARGRWVSWRAAAGTWGPFVTAALACAATGAWAFFYVVAGVFASLVAWFCVYAFVIAKPAQKVYATPRGGAPAEGARGVERIERLERRGLGAMRADDVEGARAEG